jgi:hypothetical protein
MIDDREQPEKDEATEDLEVTEEQAEDVTGGSIVNAWPKKYTGVGLNAESR